ncbi:MAG TPA: hypothetical protein PLF32_08415 [Bacteroidales bacterium]|nr:hypothetical protein [Bacteroidales bacterium]
MRVPTYILVLLLIVGFSCNRTEKKGNAVDRENVSENFEKTNSIKGNEIYYSELQFDSSLNKPESEYIIFSSSTAQDTIAVFCNCEKDIRNNRIIIQIRTDFPVHPELAKIDYSSAIMFYPTFPMQTTYLTISIKDSLVESIKINKLSQEPIFDNKYKIAEKIEKYKILLNKNKYNVAQNIWGEFEFILPVDFGIFSNDTIVYGRFYCNNSKVEKFSDVNPYPVGKVFKIDNNLTFQETSKYDSRDIYNEENSWECSCKFNAAKDTLFITNDHGDGLTGSQIAITLTKNFKPDFSYTSWTDYAMDGDYYQQYSFKKYQMRLNKNPFDSGTSGLVGTYWIATDTIPKLYGERFIKKGIFKCE